MIRVFLNNRISMQDSPYTTMILGKPYFSTAFYNGGMPLSGLRTEKEEPLEIVTKQWKFPAGEHGIVLSPDQWQESYLRNGHYSLEALVYCEFFDDSDLILIAQTVDALRSYDPSLSISLIFPYFPYSRQDRRTEEGGAHALRVVANFINSLGFLRVYTMDAHSDVLGSLVPNLISLHQATLAEKLPKFDILVAPDAGASKKVYEHKQVKKQGTHVLCASKTRELTTGKITGMGLPNANEVSGRSVCIVDDLCDGGASFLKLGALIRTYEPKSLALYVSIGLFTQGLDQLRTIFDDLYCSYSRLEDVQRSPDLRLHLLPPAEKSAS